ncbi:MAG TPA: anthranilate synthase component I family protein, partial [bacterium]|nr:anthranilate synthase component I family protein [bacterium]
VTQKFHSSQTPWEIYQAIYPSSDVSFFLDSHDFHPPNQRYSYLGANPFMAVILGDGKLEILKGHQKITKAPSELFSVLRGLFRRYRTPKRKYPPFFLGGAVGYWGYEMAALFEKIKFKKGKNAKIPDLYLGFFRDLIVFDHRENIYWLVTHLLSRDGKLKGKKDKAEAAFDRLKGYFETNLQKPINFRLDHFKGEVSKARFEQSVKRAQDYIAAGDIYQANLSQRFSFSFKGSGLALYRALRQINPSPFASFLKIRDLEIVSSSPERLIQKKDRFCLTQPIAGTRPRRMNGKNERTLARELFRDEKERAEHLMLVDLERNDLGRVCQWPSVKVKSFMKIEKYSHVIHLVSDVVGKMRKNKDAFDLIRAMFPGGTITGCPKIRCMEIIDELEPAKRGIYTGSIGWIDFKGDLDLNIVIRTILLQKNRGYLQVGAGIVHDSHPSREYEETLHKGEALVQALCEAGA